MKLESAYLHARALLEPRFEILGLSSAQWNHRLSRLPHDHLRARRARDVTPAHHPQDVLVQPLALQHRIGRYCEAMLAERWRVADAVIQERS
jgi:hypothetical protein